jgi:potassium efflux system protein
MYGIAKPLLTPLDSVIAYRIARPGSSLMTRLTSTGHHKWLHPLRYMISAAAIGVPAGLAIASLMGYHYTAYYLACRFVETIWILLALLLFDAFSHHWLRLRIRERSLEQAASSGTEAAAAGTRLVMGDGMEVSVEDEGMDVAKINTQTSRILNTVVIGGAIAGAWLIWSEVLPALSVLDDIKLWATSVETAETFTRPDGSTTVNSFTVQVPITLADLGFSIILLIVAFVAARNLPGLLEISLLERLPLVPSVRYAITSLSKYTIAAIGIVMAFNAIGISWSKVQWLVAAMTVGLAFGLQEIFANLVSGIIILFERPIRVGDVVTVGNVSGTVSRIRIRATTITDWDRKELIVPNKHFITEQILNWTLSDAIIRVIFPVSVGRGSEVARVREILHALASEHPMVLKEPEPSVIFKGFGPGALQFELRVFIHREDYSEVLNAVNSAIEAGLKKANIEIAVDRQEIRVRPSRGSTENTDIDPFTPETKKS